MELIKNNNINNRNSALFQKYSNHKYSSYLADKDLSILRSLRDDSNFIKKKLINIENTLQTSKSADCSYLIFFLELNFSSK